MDLSSSHAIVTGGASGLGGATVDSIIAAGGRATIIDINEEDGRKKSGRHGGTCRFVKADVADEELIAKAVADSVAALGPLTLAVNCAGLATPGKVLTREATHTLDLYSKVIAVNLIGTFNVLKAAAYVMQSNEADEKGNRGVIINTASVAAFEGQVGQVAYSSSKGGVAALTLPAARELSRHGIRVCAIAPGLFDTPMLRGLPPPAVEALGKSTLFPDRFGTPEEYAKLVCHIYENDMLNGETIRLDGGIRLAAR